MSAPAPDPARAAYDALERLGIAYVVHEHPPVFTVEEAVMRWAGIEATHCKNQRTASRTRSSSWPAPRWRAMLDWTRERTGPTYSAGWSTGPRWPAA